MDRIIIEYDADARDEVKAAATMSAEVLREVLPMARIEVRSVQRTTVSVRDAVGIDGTAGDGRVVRHG